MGIVILNVQSFRYTLDRKQKRQAAIGLVSGVNRVRQKWRIVLATHPMRVMMLSGFVLCQHYGGIILQGGKIVKSVFVILRRPFLLQKPDMSLAPCPDASPKTRGA
jgi:hypothetical protein